MGTHTELTNSIQSRWKTLVEDAMSVPTKYPNVVWVPPDTGEVWADITITVAASDQIDLGTEDRTVRHVGFGNVNLYFQQGGTSTAPQELVDQIVPLFRMLTVTTESELGIVFRVPRVAVIGDYQQWYVINLTLPFYLDEVA